MKLNSARWFDGHSAWCWWRDEIRKVQECNSDATTRDVGPVMIPTPGTSGRFNSCYNETDQTLYIRTKLHLLYIHWTYSSCPTPPL